MISRGQTTTSYTWSNQSKNYHYCHAIIFNVTQQNAIYQYSAYTMVAISIDKYLAIMYPMRLRMPKIQAKIIILVIWSAALMTSLPTALLSHLSPASQDSTMTATTTVNAPTQSASSLSSSPSSLQTSSSSSSMSENQSTFSNDANNYEPTTLKPLTTPTMESTTQQDHQQEQRKYFCQEGWTFWPTGKYYYSMALMILQFVLPLFVLVITYSRIVMIVWSKRMPGEEDNARDARMARSKRKVSSNANNYWHTNKSSLHISGHFGRYDCIIYPSQSWHRKTFQTSMDRVAHVLVSLVVAGFCVTYHRVS